MPVLQATAFGAFARVQHTLAAIADGGQSLWRNYFALRGAVKENDALKRQLTVLEGQLLEAQAQASQARALEAALALKQSVDAPTLVARVIAGAAAPGSLTVT